MGLQHIKAIHKSKLASLHSIVEIKKTGIELSKKFNVPLYKNIKTLLAKDKPDAVIIATPNALHESDTVRFLKYKIPVLLEKPISDNIKSAKKIINSARSNKTGIFVFKNCIVSVSCKTLGVAIITASGLFFANKILIFL